MVPSYVGGGVLYKMVIHFLSFLSVLHVKFNNIGGELKSCHLTRNQGSKHRGLGGLPPHYIFLALYLNFISALFVLIVIIYQYQP